MKVLCVAAFLLSKDSRHRDFATIYSLLHCAISERALDVAGLLLKAVTNVEKASKALVRAAEGGSIKLLLGCINAGIHIDTRDERGYTALAAASESGHLNVVQLLIDLGAQVNIPDERNYTALHNAVEEGYFQIVVLLLSAGADINFPTDRWSRTVLECAAMCGRFDIACLLIQSNQDLGKRKADCRRAALGARVLGHPVLAGELREQYTRLDLQGIEEDNSVVQARGLEWYLDLYGEGDWK